MQTKILIVEDEAITAMDVKNRLENFGFEVVGIASRGTEAISKAQRFIPNLILMDIALKGDMDGIEAASEIKTLFDIPIIYMSAFSDENTFKRAKFSNPYGFVNKPISSEVLVISIEAALYKYGLDKKLAESENRFRHILENSLDAAYRRNLESDKYDYLSPVIEKIIGFSEKEFISFSSKKLMGLIHPEDREKIEKIFEDAQSRKIKTYKVEYRLKHRNGQYVWVNDFGSIVKDGKSMFLVGSVRNITERKVREQKLKESEELTKLLLDNAGVGISYFNIDGTVLMFNKLAAEYLDGKPEDFLGKTIYELYDTDSSITLERINKCIESGESSEYMESTETPQGNRFFYYSYDPVKNLNGEVIGTQIISKDITDYKKD